MSDRFGRTSGGVRRVWRDELTSRAALSANAPAPATLVGFGARSGTQPDKRPATSANAPRDAAARPDSDRPAFPRDAVCAAQRGKRNADEAASASGR